MVIIMNIEEKQELAEIILEIVRNNLYSEFQPFKGKRKKLEAQNDISRACENTFKRFKKRGEKFNAWLGKCIAFFHWDFIDDCTLFDQWEEEHGKLKRQR